ncbi:MAG TPA: 30S ribosomal protein S16 [Armatimonadota bacterium]|nr:30S ribosomal protein S16 [Armatimonadota bacterium]
MAVKIRLRRMGARGKPFYRLVVADSHSPRDGRFIEALGYYDPRTDPPTIKIDEEKALLWLRRGAQPTDTAEALLKKKELLQQFLTAKGRKVEKLPAPAEAAPTVEEPEPKPEPAKPRRSRSSVEAAPTRRRRTKAEKEAEATAAEPQAAAESETTQEEQPSEEQG